MKDHRVAIIIAVATGCFMVGVSLLFLINKGCSPKESVLRGGVSISKQDVGFLKDVAAAIGVHSDEVQTYLIVAHSLRFRDALFVHIKLENDMLGYLDSSKDLVFSTESDDNAFEQSEINDILDEETKLAPPWFKSELQALRRMEVYIIRMEGYYTVYLFRDIISGNLYCRLVIPHKRGN